MEMRVNASALSSEYSMEMPNGSLRDVTGWPAAEWARCPRPKFVGGKRYI
jgi:hypothetical protein